MLLAVQFPLDFFVTDKKCNFFFLQFSKSRNSNSFLSYLSLHYTMDTDMTDVSAASGENPFGLSNDEWTFYQFVRASPKVKCNRRVNNSLTQKLNFLK